ncbi:hypothetical protein KAFR_0B04550 [Kazachstania africana CBS 2517]|uniref:Cytochrome b5 heme-binding domain-containing protein n=1 Tax=Kazachstania africana (strain ATCC 22294 / BCRC 22015 / CBS 2517 / CECT 1963 / NBRC 1671 / NRRL Y-8276) TaxID=1071382 RepID=H2AQV2_KAZAF|nr:hypothetical protein KAFR_0B04550 [Kazachstania africana CBS 2517]CCF56752.1 hypothetical protein KAFR_0B04550 [Kazachstania africana CBS 2517]
MSQVYTYADVAEHVLPDDCWIAIDGKVYNVSKFLDEHPGGDEIIYELAGSDATEYFLDIGHSDDALKILKTLCIGELDLNSEKVQPKKHQVLHEDEKSRNGPQGNGYIAVFVALCCLALGHYILNE